MTTRERTVRTEAIRIPPVRYSSGSCAALAQSIETEGLRHAVTVWADGTLISGSRRMFAHMLLKKERIQAVFVDTIEEAAKRLLMDNQDEYLSTPMKWSEICRLWEILRRLDAPAAAARADENRRRGVELRRLTQSGGRRPGRASKNSDDYVLTTLCEAFGTSYATAKRIDLMYRIGYTDTVDATDERRKLAREVLADVDSGGKAWPNYQRLMGERSAVVARPRPAATPSPADGNRQLAAWARSLPQMEGLVLGLTELGPPNPALTWEEIGPVHARLAAVRRDLERMIRQMKEFNQS